MLGLRDLSASVQQMDNRTKPSARWVRREQAPRNCFENTTTRAILRIPGCERMLNKMTWYRANRAWFTVCTKSDGFGVSTNNTRMNAANLRHVDKCGQCLFTATIGCWNVSAITRRCVCSWNCSEFPNFTCFSEKPCILKSSTSAWTGIIEERLLRAIWNLTLCHTATVNHAIPNPPTTFTTQKPPIEF